VPLAPSVGRHRLFPAPSSSCSSTGSRKWASSARTAAGSGANWPEPSVPSPTTRTAKARRPSASTTRARSFLFFLVALLALALLLSGIVLWFPYEFTENLRQASWVLHDGVFILFALVIVGHIYLATAKEPGTFRAMTRGTVTTAGHARITGAGIAK